MNTKQEKQTRAQFAEQVNKARDLLTDGPRNVLKAALPCPQCGTPACDCRWIPPGPTMRVEDLNVARLAGHDAWALAARIGPDSSEAESPEEARYLDAIAKLALAELARAKAKREWLKLTPADRHFPNLTEEAQRYTTLDSQATEARAALRRASEDLIAVRTDYDL